MIKTFKKIRDFDRVAGTLLKRDPALEQTKLGYAIRKMSGVLKTFFKEYQKAYSEDYINKVEKAKVDYALTDKVTGAVLTTPKGSDREYLYDKKSLQSLIEIERDFNNFWEVELENWNAKEYEFEPYYTVEVIPVLSAQEIETFKGFVIDPSYELPVKENL